MWWLALVLGCARGPVEPVPGYHVATEADQTGPFTNRLAGQSSPYLLQHAHNPVDWHPWGVEAFEEAKRRDVPVFLSIGYAACHWCHVMEEESFSDPAVAAVLNADFVPVKVDREERPDVDDVYMTAVQLVTRNGGWPASVWLMPDGRPFHAGTYFPPEPRGGRAGFGETLALVTEVWTTDRPKVEETASRLERGMTATAVVVPTPPPSGAPATGVATLLATVDREHGGWNVPKFPQASRLEWLLAWSVVHGDADAASAVALTLGAMERGGVHDQLGGGFHRYATDRAWTVPHFEKMLYDQGQLLRLYAEAAATGDARFGEVARDVADWMIRDLGTESGAFASSLDADSPGGEGAAYTWTPAQVRAAVPDRADEAMAALGVTDEGNFGGGATVLTRQAPLDPAIREALLTARATRPPPPKDGKRVVAYNALAISGLAVAGRLLGERSWVEAGERAADAVLAARRPDGSLPRTLEAGSPPAVLDDYALLTVALLDLYEATGDVGRLVQADAVATAMGALWDGLGGYHPSADATLLVRRKDWRDGAEPSGNGAAALALLRLRAWGAPSGDLAKVEAIVAAAGSSIGRAPEEHPSLSWAIDRMDRPQRQVVLAGDTIEAVAPLRAVADARWRPDTVIGVVTVGDPRAATFGTLAGKVPGADGPLAYVCVDGVCKQPVATAAELAAALD